MRRKYTALAALIITLLLALLWQNRPPAETPPVSGPLIRVLLLDGQVAQMPLEQFLPGVVAAEMPLKFAPEALKAQAIAARTYILAHSAAYGTPRHDNADICVDSTHCQAYVETQDPRALQAVAETAGLAVFYNGALAETPYCSTCGGRTQAAADVWGSDKPYLRPVTCLWDAHSPRAVAALTLSAKEVDRAALAKMTGPELRKTFALNSANCQWLIDGDSLVFITRGFGHGVGLCQYGADGLAQTGATAQDIIAHYYTGAQVGMFYTTEK